MRITYLDRPDYFEWAQRHTAGELIEFFKAAVELEKRQEVPTGTLGYDAENDELFVRRDPS